MTTVGVKERKRHNLKKGDYVLATKYWDGDPMDHWCVGRFDDILHTEIMGDRYMVVNEKNEHYRSNGFRRAETIRIDEGTYLLNHSSMIETMGLSVWGVLELFRRKKNLSK